ncbi:UDP-glucuronic acid decarboxylase 1 [Rhizodiscina lignyota]|uniref:UDP-glucuronic acid decarboxylase 1 n=1 Tax=Rhizodiscina lignyota TaxID=1504668 RepID=A0A9P4I9T9_9PEZI|nr:UDP-glucuronic acid decarboxylase 1 [Rhizodiscina lignyota]
MNGISPKHRVLVTGGAGFLGSRLVSSLLRRGHEVIVLDNFCTSFPSSLAEFQDNPAFSFVQANVTEPLSDSLKVSRIYHLACPASPVLFTQQPLEILDTCYQGTRNILEAAHRWGARVLLASTSEVYGQAERNPQDEKYRGNVNCFGPRACYDEGKRVAEALAYAYRTQRSLEIRIARIFNTYGPGMHASDGRVVCSFVGAAIEGKDLIIKGDGKSTRCFQFVDDCITGLESLMESNWSGGPVNIGSEKETTVYELAEAVINAVSALTGRPKARIVYSEALPDDPVQRRPNCTLARKILGWEARTPLSEGLSHTIDWHLNLYFIRDYRIKLVN